jgi:hydroxyacylglutathione hydrolase
MADEPDRLPPWVTWQQRPFPDANLLLLPGRNPALAGSGFAGHVGQTAELSARPHRPAAAGRNTHWHADHVGGNGILQARGAGSPGCGAVRPRRRDQRDRG